MNRLDLLAKLQAVDDKIQDNLRSQGQLRERLGDDSDVNAALSASKSAEGRVEELRARLRLHELEVNSLSDKIKGVNARLFDGTVSNPKELKGLEQDQAMLNRQKSLIEDRMLELMSDIETAEQSASAQTVQVKDLTDKRQTAVSQDLAKLKTLESRSQELVGQQTALRAQIEPADLTLYDSLRQEKKGVAVSHLRGTACGGCGFGLPSGHASRVRMEAELVNCPNCGRILVP